MQLYIATHKHKVTLHTGIYLPIHVGAALQPQVIGEGYIQDNTGDNISLKNKTYNELTALYWVWKNTPKATIVGLMHYRRYFNFLYNRFAYKQKGQVQLLATDMLVQQLITKQPDVQKRIKKYLSTNNVLVPYLTKIYVNTKEVTVAEDYDNAHVSKDWHTMRNVILTVHPAYINSFDAIGASNLIYYGNMFVATKTWTCAYCEWLFSLLTALEKQIDISTYDAYQQRVYGFMAERLFNVYLHYNKCKVKMIPVIFERELL